MCLICFKGKMGKSFLKNEGFVQFLGLVKDFPKINVEICNYVGVQKKKRGNVYFKGGFGRGGSYFCVIW